MSKTWKKANAVSPRKYEPVYLMYPTPQATVDRLRKAEARSEIREALQPPQEAQHAE